MKYHDIALIKLSRPAMISENVRPALLPSIDGNKDRNDSIFIIAGWGAIGPYEGFEEKLRKVELKSYTNDYCKKVYKARAF